jgi:hypothetical protein
MDEAQVQGIQRLLSVNFHHQQRITTHRLATPFSEWLFLFRDYIAVSLEVVVHKGVGDTIRLLGFQQDLRALLSGDEEFHRLLM